jgi:pyruvate dehydrogenase (quinone)
LRQQQLPVKVIVLNNGALAFVELEMKADGFVNFGTDLDNPSFAEIARAVGLYATRVERPSELNDAIRGAFAHPGPAVVEVMTIRHELSIPPRVSLKQATGFTLWATRSVLSGDGGAVIEVARSNLRQLAIE